VRIFALNCFQSPIQVPVSQRFDLDLTSLTSGLEHRVQLFPWEKNAFPTAENWPRDKWLLSSAVQKLIRRGQAETAVSAALALHHIEPRYLPRRLPIIALEDVGIGGIDACVETVTAFCAGRSMRLRPPEEQRRTIAYLVVRLARAEKSRAACDLLSLASATQLDSTEIKSVALLDAGSLTDVATDCTSDLVSRVNALRVLSGLTLLEAGSHRTLTRRSHHALLRVAERTASPSAIVWLVELGRYTEGLAAMLPLVFEKIRGDTAFLRSEGLQSPALDRAGAALDGFPLMAADQYTRVGREVFRRLMAQSSALRDALARWAPRADAVKLIGMALFHTEGSRLDRWITTDWLEELRERTEEAELLQLRLLDRSGRKPLYELLECHAGEISTLRREVLSSVTGTASEDRQERFHGF